MEAFSQLCWKINASPRPTLCKSAGKSQTLFTFFLVRFGQRWTLIVRQVWTIKDCYLKTNCFLMCNHLKKKRNSPKLTHKRSILAFRIAKFGPLGEPVRILISLWQVCHIFKVISVIRTRQYLLKYQISQDCGTINAINSGFRLCTLNVSETLLLTWGWSLETGSESFNSLRPEGEGVSTLGEGEPMSVFGSAGGCEFRL